MVKVNISQIDRDIKYEVHQCRYLIFTLGRQSPPCSNQVRLQRQNEPARPILLLGDQSTGRGCLCVTTDLASESAAYATNLYYDTGRRIIIRSIIGTLIPPTFKYHHSLISLANIFVCFSFHPFNHLEPRSSHYLQCIMVRQDVFFPFGCVHLQLESLLFEPNVI